jgi:hypothetical protein
LTPNFQSYLVRMHGGDWKPSGAAVVWDVHPGANRLEAKTVNLFGVEGPISSGEFKTDSLAADARDGT